MTDNMPIPGWWEPKPGYYRARLTEKGPWLRAQVIYTAHNDTWTLILNERHESVPGFNSEGSPWLIDALDACWRRRPWLHQSVTKEEHDSIQVIPWNEARKPVSDAA
jgi:hypothetical protein